MTQGKVVYSTMGRKVRGPSNHKKWIEVTNGILTVNCHYTDDVELEMPIDEALFLAWQCIFEMAEARSEEVPDGAYKFFQGGKANEDGMGRF